MKLHGHPDVGVAGFAAAAGVVDVPAETLPRAAMEPESDTSTLPKVVEEEPET